ncbi:hypothetical protein PIB30_047148 [Stylosanthes scabra]|uniref:Uncharacterized protein n=1 Tax=Stylosanthes scabra TaxID=79078 RepID=A0ABU6WGD0_9FABA|nr:hypothetical protein [Stylosanthes scabra]
MNLSDFVVVTLYPNGEMGRDSGGIWFRSATPMVFQMQPVNTLEELKAVILRNMRVASRTMLVRRDSDEDFFGDTEESSESSDGTEFVPESQCKRDFLLPAPAPIPDLSSVSSHFQTLYLDDMGEQPREGFGGGGEDYDVDGGQEFRVGHRFCTKEAVQMAVKN